ncbi:uncharacterized protein LOC128555311 isoform X3 [Mercenaria mercenaria]|uniref:uncharacterized protein LOC128555311 isoform X3 n=1 Tax=Mercenaria mercenaria TaxID=6596 RepID=UPI00234E521F|nr:uncharacterized protein LOC128555311 isoform X3 [Mercenaria mercenaria]
MEYFKSFFKGYTDISVHNSSSSQAIELTDTANPTSQSFSAETRVTVNNSVGAGNNAVTSNPTVSDNVTPATSDITGAIEGVVALRMLPVSLNRGTGEETLQEENNIDSLDGYNRNIGDIATGQLFEVNNEAIQNFRSEEYNRNRNEFGYNRNIVDIATGQLFEVNDETIQNFWSEENNRNRNELVEYAWYPATIVDLGDPATGRISPIDENLNR